MITTSIITLYKGIVRVKGFSYFLLLLTLNNLSQLVRIFIRFMAAAERIGRQGLTILLASQEPADINAAVRGVQKVFPLPEERRRNFVVVRELPKDEEGEPMYDISERVEFLGNASMFQLYEGPLATIKHLRRVAHISTKTLGAIAPHVLIVAQLQPEENHHLVPRETPSLYRGFMDAQARLDRAIRQNDVLSEPVDYNIAIGLRSIYLPFPEGDLHLECVVARDRDERQTRSTSASGIVDQHIQTGDLMEREELLLHPIEIALRNIRRLREQEENV